MGDSFSMSKIEKLENEMAKLRARIAEEKRMEKKKAQKEVHKRRLACGAIIERCGLLEIEEELLVQIIEAGKSTVANKKGSCEDVD